MEVYISGSLAYDRIMDFPGKFEDHILPDKIHVLNVCFTVNGLKENYGGTAGNIAYSLSLLGVRPKIVAAAGSDFGKYEEWLKKRGLSTDGIRRITHEFTAGAYITTDQADNQITGFNPGAMKYPSQFAFDNANCENVLSIIAPGNREDMLGYSRIFKERKIPFIFDPGQQIPVFSGAELEEMLTGAELFISNDYELEMTKRATGLKKADILKRTNGIITTLGEEGSVVCTKEEEVRIPAVSVDRVLDPTGAGDAYRAGLIKGLTMKKSLIDAGRIGTISASYAVASYGTQEHEFSQEAFWSRYKAVFGKDG